MCCCLKTPWFLRPISGRLPSPQVRSQFVRDAISRGTPRGFTQGQQMPAGHGMSCLGNGHHLGLHMGQVDVARFRLSFEEGCKLCFLAGYGASRGLAQAAVHFNQTLTAGYPSSAVFQCQLHSEVGPIEPNWNVTALGTEVVDFGNSRVLEVTLAKLPRWLYEPYSHGSGRWSWRNLPALMLLRQICTERERETERKRVLPTAAAHGTVSSLHIRLYQPTGHTSMSQIWMGRIWRKLLFLMIETMVSGFLYVAVPLNNQSTHYVAKKLRWTCARSPLVSHKFFLSNRRWQSCRGSSMLCFPKW